MRVLLKGNWQGCHCGSAAVWGRIRQLVEERSDLQLIRDNGLDWLRGENYECLIINGEGTMHDNARGAIRMLEQAKAVKRSGRQVHLINSVWQNMTAPEIEIVKELDSVFVRESISFSHIEPLYPHAKIATDLSYDMPVKISGEKGALFRREYSPTKAVGGFFVPHNLKWPREEYTRLSIRNYIGGAKTHSGGPNQHLAPPRGAGKPSKWEDYLNALSGASLLITGLHHEVLAACKLRIPFVAYRGNTDKVLGIIQRAKVDIPVASNPNELKNNIKKLPPIDQYEKLFDFLADQKPFTLEHLGI